MAATVAAGGGASSCFAGQEYGPLSVSRASLEGAEQRRCSSGLAKAVQFVLLSSNYIFASPRPPPPPSASPEAPSPVAGARSVNTMPLIKLPLFAGLAEVWPGNCSPDRRGWPPAAHNKRGGAGGRHAGPLGGRK